MNWTDQSIAFLALGLIMTHQGTHAWDRRERYIGILLYLTGIVEIVIGFYSLVH